MPAFFPTIGRMPARPSHRGRALTFRCIRLLGMFACLGGCVGCPKQAPERDTELPPTPIVGQEAPAALNEDQTEATRSWEAGKARLAKADADAAPAESDDDTLAGAVQHDALLEVADRFDQALQREPDHLGMLRDLCTCYGRLLVFEQTSALAPTICVQAARRLTEYEQKAAPLDKYDLALVKNVRAWLFIARGIYPCATELIEESSGGADAAALRRSLTKLGQDKFEKFPELPVGDLKCEVYGARGESPHPDFLWGEVFFVISPPGDKRPEQTVAYVLTRCGKAPAVKYYLYFRSLDDAEMLKLYGGNRPALPALRGEVEQFVKTALAKGRKEK